MSAEAARHITLQTYLCSESRQRPTRLQCFEVAQERSKSRKDTLDKHVAFDDPLEVVKTAVALDPPHSENIPQS